MPLARNNAAEGAVTDRASGEPGVGISRTNAGWRSVGYAWVHGRRRAGMDMTTRSPGGEP